MSYVKFLFGNLFQISRVSRLKLHQRHLSDLTSYNQPSQDILLKNLKSTVKIDQILNDIGHHYQILNNQHVIQALNTIFSLQKANSSNVTNKEIINHPGFELLCKKIQFKSREMELSDIIQSLKILNFLGVPSNSKIVQILLQMIRSDINQINLNQILFLDFLFRHYKEHTPLSEALQIAMPILFNVNLTKEVNYANLPQLCDLLHFISKNQSGVTKNSIGIIVDAILKFINKNQVDVKQAKSILWSICDLKPDEYYKCIINDRLFEILIREIDQMPLKDLETTLSKMNYCYSISDNFKFYYNEHFLNACSDYIICKDLGYDCACYMINRFVKMSHINHQLLNYIGKKIHGNEENLIQNGSIFHVISFIDGLAAANYKSIDNFEKIIKCCVNKLEDEAIIGSKQAHDLKMSWIDAGINFAVLGIFNRIVLKKAFEMAKQNFRLTSKKLKRLYTLQQAIFELNPENSDVADLVLNNKFFSENKVENMHLPLKPFLETALGGSSYIRTGIDANIGYLIDHAIIMRKGGYSVAFSPEIPENYVSLSDLVKFAGNNQIIAIICFKDFLYANNADILKPVFRLILKILESRNVTPLPISLKKWNDMLEHERIPYIMQVIKEHNGNFVYEETLSN